MKAIIFAAGKGKKLYPYSSHWQKSAIPICNVPNVLNNFKIIQGIGIDNIKVVVGYKDNQVRYALRNENVEYIESKIDGTAPALLATLDEECLVIYGDIVVHKTDIELLINNYKNTGNQSLLYSKFSKYERSIDWIGCNVEETQVTAIYGHPREHYINGKIGGVFVLDKRIKKYLEGNPGYMKNISVGDMPIDECMIEQSIQMMIEDGEVIDGVLSSMPIIDIDKPWHIMEANEQIILQEVANIEDDIIYETAKIDSSAIIEGKIVLGKNSYIGKNVIIKGNVVIGDNTEIDYGAIIEGNVIIGNNTIIKDYCKILPLSTIGNKNKIGYNAEFQGITFDGVSITHNAEIYGIVGEYTDIAAGCMAGILRFDDCLNTPKIDGRIEVGSKYTNGIFIGDHCRTGVGNIFMPGIMIGKNCVISPGAVVSNNLAEGTLLIIEQNQIYKTWGPERYGW